MKFKKLPGLLALALLAAPTFAFAADIVVPSEPIVQSVVRISWSAVFAGMAVAVAAHLALSTLGIGLGAAAVDPYDRENPTKGVPTAMLAWMFGAGLVALFIGGWVAGRLAGTVPFDSAIHGVITWALATVTTFYLASTSLGYVMGGAFRLLADGASAAAQAAAAVAPGAAKMAKDAIAENVPQFDWKVIKREADKLLHETGKDGLAPDALANKVAELKDQGAKAAKSGQQRPEHADEEVGELLSQTYGVVRETVNAADRDALVDVITAKTGVSKDEAGKTLDKWEKMYVQAKQKYQQLVAQAEQTARETADAAMTAIRQVAGWTFASLVFGMLVAAVGGNLGSTYVQM